MIALRKLFHSEALTQLARFVVAGLGVTALSVAIYLVYAIVLHVNPLLANIVSHFGGVAAGYAIHSRWSFRGSGEQSAASLGKFALVSGIALALNSCWVWIATVAMHGPAWAPVPAMLFATPLASFTLNRYWVFAPRTA
ncbi:hypothetical protein GCM10009087_29320 [Sphingomonas oligophenolica]|uniref:GtrA family protein n=1 Tax=Sphingomonas oligophenolica TaxID=301154 RepID=A0ABU9YB75_9SPHN